MTRRNRESYKRQVIGSSEMPVGSQSFTSDGAGYVKMPNGAIKRLVPKINKRLIKKLVKANGGRSSN